MRRSYWQGSNLFHTVPQPWREYRCRSQPTTTVRQSDLSFHSYGRRRLGQWRIPSTQKCKLMLQCDGLQESCGYHEACCLFRLGVRRREATSTLCHAACWKDKRFPWCVASFADLWDIPAAIFFTPVPSTKESANAGLNHRPLWDNDSRHSACCCKRSDQWAICSAQSWCLNKLELGRRLGKPLALAFLWESRCLFGSELRIGPIVLAGTAHACPTLMSCQCCKLMGPSSSLRNINPEYQRECRHAGVNQWPFCDNRTRYSAHACLCRKSSDQWVFLP